MRNPKILVIDSGAGGLTVTAHIRQRCPGVTVAYIADIAHFPYGAKTEAEVTSRIQALVASGIQRVQPDLVVIACNTASTVALEVLRATHKLPFVGVVPAIKPAAAKSRTGVIGVLATHGTINRRYTQNLIDSYAHGNQVVLYGSSHLVEFGERRLRGELINLADIQADVIGLMEEHPRMDTVVLACTHFPLLRDELQSVFPSIRFWVDSGEAIARRVEFLLNQLGLPAVATSIKINNTLLLTAPPSKPYQKQLIIPLLGEFELSTLEP